MVRRAKKLPKYFYELKNIFLILLGEASGLDSKFIEDIDIDAIAADENPYCYSFKRYAESVCLD